MIRQHQTAASPFVLSVIILSLALPGVVPVAHACTCMQPGPPLQEMERADAVFSGRVVSIEPEDPDAEDAPVRGFVERLRVTLELDKVWKGVDEGKTVEVLTASQSAMCGFTFKEGEPYLVYAYRSRQQEDGPEILTATLCSRTAHLERAADDLDALGTPQRTVQADETHP